MSIDWTCTGSLGHPKSIWMQCCNVPAIFTALLSVKERLVTDNLMMVPRIHAEHVDKCMSVGVGKCTSLPGVSLFVAHPGV